MTGFYVHHELVSSRNHPKVVVLKESVCHVRPKDITSRSRRGIEAHSGLIRVRPKQIAHGTSVGDVHEPIDCSDVVYFLNLGTQATMDAENHIVYKGSER